MTATATLERPTPPPPAAPEVKTYPVTLARVTASEWIKFRTLRSTLAVLAAAVATVVAIGLIVAYNTRHLSANLQPDDLVPSATMQGYLLAQLLIGALGIMFVSGEYSTGMIRSTLAAVPRRLPVLWAKGAVVLTVAAVTMLAACTATFLGAQALIGHYRTGYSLTDPGVARVVLGTALYLTLLGLLGSAIGWIMRNTPGALVTFAATVLVLPVLFGRILGTWGKDVGQYLPSTAGGSFISSTRTAHTLTPWTGLAVLGLWVVAGIAIAAVRLRHRDA